MDDLNQLIARLLHNFSIKVNEEVGRYKRETFNISVGDELPAGVLKVGQGVPRQEAQAEGW